MGLHAHDEAVIACLSGHFTDSKIAATLGLKPQNYANSLGRRRKPGPPQKAFFSAERLLRLVLLARRCQPSVARELRTRLDACEPLYQQLPYTLCEWLPTPWQSGWVSLPDQRALGTLATLLQGEDPLLVKPPNRALHLLCADALLPAAQLPEPNAAASCELIGQHLNHKVNARQPLPCHLYAYPPAALNAASLWFKLADGTLHHATLSTEGGVLTSDLAPNGAEALLAQFTQRAAHGAVTLDPGGPLQQMKTPAGDRYQLQIEHGKRSYRLALEPISDTCQYLATLSCSVPDSVVSLTLFNGDEVWLELQREPLTHAFFIAASREQMAAYIAAGDIRCYFTEEP